MLAYSHAGTQPVPWVLWRCSLSSLIRKLLEIQEGEGWLSPERLQALSREVGVPLHRLESLSTFYTHFQREPPKGALVEVCRDLSCQLAGGQRARQRLESALAGGPPVDVRPVSCLGRCDMAPAAAVLGRAMGMHDTAAVKRSLENPDASGEPAPPRVWQNMQLYDNPDARYGTLRSLLDCEPSELSARLEASELRGMGGAAFPTGRKWSLVAAAPAGPRHVIANADESEPGSFKDREILASLPHLVLEGMALAGRCIGAEHGTVFIRHEYEPERRALETALAEAQRLGALGQGIFGSQFNFQVEIFVSPGGYILGDETALLECLEDRRGEPRNKPPYPGTSGLWGQPTLINNVETFAHATTILHHGPDWWHDLGRPGFSGQKFLSVSGDVAQAGVQLVPSGVTLGEVLERCGGMRDGRPLGAVAPGGASSNFLPPSALDVAVDFQTLADAGSMLGSGGMVFVADDQDLLEVALNVTRFFRNESCGKCVPCRIGTEKAVALVEQQKGISGDIGQRLNALHETLARTSICGLGQIALAPMLSLAKLFPERLDGR